MNDSHKLNRSHISNLNKKKEINSPRPNPTLSPPLASAPIVKPPTTNNHLQHPQHKTAINHPPNPAKKQTHASRSRTIDLYLCEPKKRRRKAKIFLDQTGRGEERRSLSTRRSRIARARGPLAREEERARHAPMPPTLRWRVRSCGLGCKRSKPI